MNEMILFVIGFAVTLIIVVAADIMLARQRMYPVSWRS